MPIIKWLLYWYNLVTICRPKFIEYVGFTDAPYLCGQCGGETKDVTCEECTTSGCNTPPTTAPDFHCYRYDYNETSNKFIPAGNITCKRLANTDVFCNE
jgi:hypothetical protein